MNLIDFLMSEEAMLVYVIGLVLSIIYIVFYIVKKNSRNRKLRHNTMELKKLSEEVMDLAIRKENNTKIHELPTVATLSEQKPIEVVETYENVSEVKKEEVVVPVVEENNNKIVIEEIEDIEDSVGEINTVEEVSPKEELTYTTIEPPVEEAKKELQEITEKLENNEKEENIELTEFERMQEDTAIISLDELMKKANELYEKNEEVQYQDDGNEPITIQEFEARRKEMNEIVEEKTVEEETITLESIYNTSTIPVVEHRFQSSPVISPVYGITRDENINRNVNMELENTANYEKLDEEIRKTNQFIAALKEIQKEID